MERTRCHGSRAKTEVDTLVVPEDVLVAPNLKWCPGCGAFVERELFHKQPGRPDGIKQRCRDCWNTKQREWYQERKRIQIEQRRMGDG